MCDNTKTNKNPSAVADQTSQDLATDSMELKNPHDRRKLRDDGPAAVCDHSRLDMDLHIEIVKKLALNTCRQWKLAKEALASGILDAKGVSDQTKAQSDLKGKAIAYSVMLANMYAAQTVDACTQTEI